MKLTITLLSLFLFTSLSYSQDLFFSSINLDFVGAVNQDGTGTPVTLFDNGFGLDNVRGIAVDNVNNLIYWTSVGTDDISVGNLDGTGSPTVLYSGLINPNNIAIDVSNNLIYWTEASNPAGRIMVGTLDGSGTPTTVFSDVNARGISIDLTNNVLYWAEVINDRIRMGNADGSGDPITLFDNPNDGVDGPFGIEVDLVNSLIYWSEVGTGGEGGNSISVGNLDGSGSPTVLFCSNLNGINDPRSIAINFDEGQIFWVELGSDAIKVANLDGSGNTDLLFSDLNNPVGLAFGCLLYTSPSPRDATLSRMPSSA